MVRQAGSAHSSGCVVNGSNGYGCRLSYYYYSIHCVYYTVPTGPPTSVSSGAITATNITVRWEQVACLDRNGEITGYTIVVTRNRVNETVPARENETVYVEVGGNVRKTVVSELSPSTDYSVRVAAVNGAGVGPHSDTVKYKTLQC